MRTQTVCSGMLFCAACFVCLFCLTTANAGIGGSVADVDLDGDVDNGDLAIILGNDGLGGTATLADGDVDSDGAVGENDFDIAVSEFNVGAGGFGGFLGALTPGSDPALLLYNPMTGNVQLDQTNAPGGVISTFILETGGTFAALGTAIFPFSGNLFTDQSSVIAQSDPASFDPALGFAANPYNLGPLLPTGLDFSGLSSAISGAVYVGETGTGVREFELMVIPEPTSLWLFAVGSAVVLWSRRHA